MAVIQSRIFFMICLAFFPKSFAGTTTEEWPNCKAYQAVVKSTPAPDKSKIQNTLNSALQELETAFDRKLTKLRDSYNAALEDHIKEMRAAQHKVEYHAVTWAKEEHDVIKQYSHVTLNTFHGLSVSGAHDGPKEAALDEITHICDKATEETWLNAGDTDQTIKSMIAKLGIPVKNHYDYDDINHRMDTIANEIHQMLNSLLNTENYLKLERCMNHGRKSIVERFRGPVEEIAQRITKWKETVVDRASRAQQTDDFPFLMNKMKTKVDKSVKEINELLETIFGPDAYSWCNEAELERASYVIECLMADTDNTPNTLQHKIRGAVEFLSAVNRELELMGQ